MTRLSGKTIITRTVVPQTAALPSDFNKLDFEASIREKGYETVHEKAYNCPCISQPSIAPLNTCKNCGGTGWIFANPTRTKMIITTIMLDDKLKEGALREWGMLDMGAVKITAYNQDKLTYMDRITILDATSEHNQILFPKLDDEEEVLFAYTKYDIKSIDFIGLFESADTIIKKLEQGTDYTFVDNIITFDDQYSDLPNATVTIRYVHNPAFHVIDILRESMTSTEQKGNVKQILPIHAIGKRAHIIKDAENFDGNRLLDNSWLPNACATEEFTKFQRQLRHTSAQEIFDSLTATQIDQLDVLIHDSDSN